MNTVKKIFSFVFGTILCLGLISYIVVPQKAFSEKENRPLATVPELSLETLSSNEFSSLFENYANDQFIFRDFAVSLKADLEKWSGKKENNGIYFAKDNYLIEKPSSTDTKIAENNINSLVKVDSLGKYDISLMLIPTAFEIHADKLPENAYVPIQKELSNLASKMLSSTNVTFIDPTDILSEYKNEYIYYRNDHHQTSYGSFLSYEAWGNAKGVETYKESDFDKKDLTNVFLGTTWSRSSLFGAKGDTLSIYEPKFDIGYEVNYVIDNKKSDSMYEFGWLDKKDKYSVFFDGNHPIVTIDTTNKNGKKIAVFKDSYANSFLPFLVNHYESVFVIDLRYYNMNPLDYLESNNIDEILVLYNSANFITDTNCFKLGAFIK